MTTARTDRTGDPTVGLTQDAGWEIGVSRTIDAPLPAVWAYLTSQDGITRWLGGGLTLPAEKGAAYATPAGIRGEVRSFHPEDRIRLSWQPTDWDHASTVQVAVRARGEKTLLRFHQEKLADAAERERQRAHWSAVLQVVVDELSEATDR
ncbi:MAG: SRPBCC domain-containing protein, partial [Nakamurella sp.]